MVKLKNINKKKIETLEEDNDKNSQLIKFHIQITYYFSSLKQPKKEKRKNRTLEEDKDNNAELIKFLIQNQISHTNYPTL